MKKKSILKTLITFAVAAAVIASIGWVLANNKKKNEAKTAIVAQSISASVSVKVTPVQQEVLDMEYSANGHFAPDRELNFSAENSGRVTNVLVDEGAYVKVGQVLATVKADNLNIDLESATASLQNAARDKERFENAYRTGGVTQQQLDQAKLALENAEARVAQARIRVRDANVRSSINGIVNKRFIEPGAVVAPGTQLFELVDVSKLKLKVSVNESQVAKLKTGDKLTVKASVFPDKAFTGKVTFIAAKADNALNFPVEISIANTSGNHLKAGMYGTAIFENKNPAPVTVIPRSSFAGSVSSNQVFVADSENIARIRKVVSGRVLGDKVEILDGLQQGENVITSGQINLTEGSKVSLLQ